jgi:hypothetical protein
VLSLYVSERVKHHSGSARQYIKGDADISGRFHPKFHLPKVLCSGSGYYWSIVER